MPSTWLLLLILANIIHSCIGGRHFIRTELKKNPLGFNGRSTFKRKYSTKLATTASKYDDKQSRFASVYDDEAESLGLTLPPKLKSNPIIHDCDDEFDPYYDPSRVIYASTTKTIPTSQSTRGGGTSALIPRPLVFWENMVAGAISRSIAQTVMHPANTMKTILQSSRGADRPTLGQLFRPSMFKTLTRGAGANFILSVPHGAVNFAVLEFVRSRLNIFVESVPSLSERKDSMGPGLDFLSSAISTICCSIVSTPQMMITDNIMAGNFPALNSAVQGLYQQKGIMGFYAGWWPGLVGKIPSYALTWTFFQQLKRARDFVSDRPAKTYENTVMGCMASATTVCIMIPLDTIKTRLVTQTSSAVINGTPYKGIIDCALRISREEGIKTFYRGLPPRLLSVVPMIGIQFGVYEAMKKVMLQRQVEQQQKKGEVSIYGPAEALEEAAMEVAASSKVPEPAPHFSKQSGPKRKRF